MLAVILWAGFQFAIIAVIAGLFAQVRGRRHLALALFLLAVVFTLAFSYIGGFSIGRFTALIPVLVIGYVVGMGRGPAVVAGCALVALLIYATFSWVLTTRLPTTGPLMYLFGSWAIPLYTILGLAAFIWAFARPPR